MPDHVLPLLPADCLSAGLHRSPLAPQGPPPHRAPRTAHRLLSGADMTWPDALACAHLHLHALIPARHSNTLSTFSLATIDHTVDVRYIPSHSFRPPLSAYRGASLHRPTATSPRYPPAVFYLDRITPPHPYNTYARHPQCLPKSTFAPLRSSVSCRRPLSSRSQTRTSLHSPSRYVIAKNP